MSTPRVSRKCALKSAVAALIMEAGFDGFQSDCLTVLTELMHSYLVELAFSTKSYTEAAGRTDPMVTDVISGLVDVGATIQGLVAFSRRQNRVPIPEPQTNSAPSETQILRVGQPEPFPSYIPAHLPPFPDPHTYIRTQTKKMPMSDYKLIREKISEQSRHTDLALTRFLAKTGDNENLFPDEPYAFPLIENKLRPKRYLGALQSKKEEAVEDEWMTSKDELEERQSRTVFDSTRRHSILDQPIIHSLPLGQSSEFYNSNGQIDNPYLRPINMPKLKTDTFRKNRV